MMNLSKLLLIGTLFAGATASAFASPIQTGTLDINGTFKLVGSGATSGIDFLVDPTSSSSGTGLFTNLNGTNDVQLSTNFTFSQIKPGTGELLFTIVKGGTSVNFMVTSYSYSATTLTFTGYLSANSGQSAPATFVEQLKSTGDKTYSYTGELVVTPEPNSILLLGTGLLATCGMISIKRRRTANVAV